jgi:hypothetical protein
MTEENMKKLFASVLCVALAVTMSPTNLLAAAGRQGAGAQANTGEVSGIATTDKGDVLAGYRARLLNSDNNNAIIGETRTSSAGEFKFTGLPVGNYFVEIVDEKGVVVARTVKISLAAGAMAVTGLALSGSAAGVAVAGAAGGAFLATTAGIVTAVAVGAGITAAVVATTNDASSSGG